jgi:hypothetical protein
MITDIIMRHIEKFKETDLAAVVVDWLESEDWEVYQEICFDGGGSKTADIVAVKDGHIWIIETKLSLTLQVLAQANSWDCQYRSVAVLKSKRSQGRDFAFRVCQKFDLGLIEVNISGHDVISNLEPALRTTHYVEIVEKSMLKKLAKFHKNGIAGSQAGGSLTPYKMTMLKIREFITNHPSCTLNDIISNVGIGHYSSEQSAKGSIRSALENWEEDWCKVEWKAREYTYSIKQMR